MTSNRQPTVSMAYARSLMDYVRSLSIDPAQVFTAQEVAAIEDADADSKDSLHHWLGLLAQAVRSTADPDMPLKIGASFKIRHLGLAGYVLMSCRTLDEVGQQARRYMSLLGDVGVADLVRRGKFSELRLNWQMGTPPPAMQQIFMAATVSLGRWLTARSDLAFDACFQLPRPREFGEYKRLFRGKVFFGRRATKLVFPTRYLDLPLATGSPLAMKIVEAHAQAMLRAPGARASPNDPESAALIAAVRAAMEQGLSLGRVTLDDVGPALGLSKRSLQRRLAESGVSFHALLEEARHSHAKAFLGNPAVSLAEIAFLLGYTEQSTFQQAFKRWTGRTPGEYRRQVAGKASA